MNKKIQVIRGCAIIAVVVIHTYNVNGGGYGIVVRSFVNFAVGLFVFLSGLLTIEKNNSYKDLIYRRLKKIIPPYIIWSFIFALLNGRVSTFVPDIFMSKCNGIYYFILVYIQMVFLTPVAFKLLKSKYKIWGWFVTPVTIVLIQYICVCLNIRVGFPLQGELFGFWFGFYYLGLAIKNKYIIINPEKNQIMILYIMALLLQVVEGVLWNKVGNYDMATTQLKLSSIFTTVVACLGAFAYVNNEKISCHHLPKKMVRFLEILGNNSFGIYLCHMLVIRIQNKLMPSLSVFPINTILGISASLLVVLIGHRVLRKYAYIIGL